MTQCSTQQSAPQGAGEQMNEGPAGAYRSVLTLNKKKTIMIANTYIALTIASQYSKVFYSFN